MSLPGRNEDSGYREEFPGGDDRKTKIITSEEAGTAEEEATGNVTVKSEKK